MALKPLTILMTGLGRCHKVEVDVGVLFAKEVLNFPADDRKKIKAFIDHLKANGFNALKEETNLLTAYPKMIETS